MYSQDMNECGIIDDEIRQYYKNNAYHRVFIAEKKRVLIPDENE